NGSTATVRSAVGTLVVGANGTGVLVADAGAREVVAEGAFWSATPTSSSARSTSWTLAKRSAGRRDMHRTTISPKAAGRLGRLPGGSGGGAYGRGGATASGASPAHARSPVASS